MRLSRMLFFLCFRPTIKFKVGRLLTVFSNPLPTPLLTRPLKNYFYRHFGVSEICLETTPVSPYPLNPRGDIPPPKFTLRPSKNICHPQNLGGLGLQGPDVSHGHLGLL